MAPALDDFRHLLRLRARGAANGLRFLPPRSRFFAFLFFAASAALAIAIYIGFGALLRITHQAGEPVTHRLIERVLFYVFLFLFAGGLPFVSGALLTPGDLPLLASSPVRPAAVVAGRLLDAILISSAQFVVIGIPLLIASAAALGYGIMGWLGFLCLLLLYLALPALLLAALLLGAARALGVRRVRWAVALVSALLSVLMCLLTVKEFSQRASAAGVDTATIARSLAALPASPAWLPSTWAADMMLGTAKGDIGRAATGFLTLALAVWVTGAAAIGLGAPVLIGESLLEGDGGGSYSSGRDLLSRLMARAPLSPPIRALVTKDLRYIGRDLVLLSQIGVPLILYFVPYVIGSQIGDRGSATSDLFLLTVGIVGTILYMETSILGLSSVGLEGRGFWMVLAAPISSGTLVAAKWWGAFGASAGIGLPLFWIACTYYRAPGAWYGIGTAVLLLSCAALTGIGVGIAGIFPRFAFDNPAHRASAAALIWGFVAATAYVIFAGVALGGSYWLGLTFPERASVMHTLGFGLYVVISLAACLLPLLTARARLDGYAWEE